MPDDHEDLGPVERPSPEQKAKLLREWMEGARRAGNEMPPHPDGLSLSQIIARDRGALTTVDEMYEDMTPREKVKMLRMLLGELMQTEQGRAKVRSIWREITEEQRGTLGD